MAVIQQTEGVVRPRMPKVLSRTTLTSGTDVLEFQRGCGQALILFNPTGGSLTTSLAGTAPAVLLVPGYGLLPTAPGKGITVAAGGFAYVPLDSIWAPLSGTGTVSLTGGAGLSATLHSTIADPVTSLYVTFWNDAGIWNDSGIWNG